jgi:ABC-type uncharacterized transport system auxiliary subunit
MKGPALGRGLGHWSGWLVLQLLLVFGSGCALLSKAAPLSPRYFSPELEDTAPASAAPGPASLELRLGRVEAAAHLEQRVAYRPSESELGYYESYRWTEPPEAYLERALSQQLFARGGLVHVVSGAALTLDVALIGFEEIRAAPARARVEVRALLHDERRVLLERTVRRERPIPAGPAEDAPIRLTKALSDALEVATVELAVLVKTELAKTELAPGR